MRVNNFLIRIYPIVFLLIVFGLFISTIFRMPIRTFKLKTARNDVENFMDNNITGHSSWIDLFGLFQRILGKHEIDDFTVIKDSAGMLHQQPECRTNDELERFANNLTEIYHHLADQGIEFLYVQAPNDLIEEKTVLLAGHKPPSGESIDNFLEMISQRGIPVLDARILFNKWRPDEIFFRTDHHWRVEAAFCTASSILASVGKEMAPTEEFQILYFPNTFLGSLGVKAGKFYTGMDSFTVLIPTFDTHFQINNEYSDGKKMFKSGNFSEVLLDLELLESGYLNKYNTLIYGADRKTEIINFNREMEETLLIVADSFGRAIVPYLSLEFYRTIFVDPQAGRYDNGVLTFIDEVKPDIVLVLFNGRSIFIPIE